MNTLLEILVEELPKRGGWPKGAEFIASDADGEIDSYRNLPIPDRSGYNYIDSCGEGYHKQLLRPFKFNAVDWDCSVISRDQYEAALAASQDANSRANDDRLEQDLNDCIGQAPEDKTQVVLELIASMQDADVNLRLNDAFELAETLVDAGYRKQ